MYVRLDTHIGFQAAFSNATTTSKAPAFISDDTLDGVNITYNKTIPSSFGGSTVLQGNLFTALSYDAATDRLIITRGGIQSFQMFTGIALVWAPLADLYPSTWMHVILDPDSLNPTKNLSIEDIASYVVTVEGDGYGFCRDPNTGVLYQSIWDFFIQTDHGSDRYTYGYGKTKSTSGKAEKHPIIGAYSQYFIESIIAEIATNNKTGTFGSIYAITLHDLIVNGGLVSKIEPKFGANTTPNVLVFDNVVIFAFEDLYHKSFLSVMERGTGRWLGSRMMPFGHAMQLCPTGTDRGILIAWMNGESDSPLIAASFEWDRSGEQLLINKVDTITTSHDFVPHIDVGHATYDSNRQAIVLLKSDEDTFERYVTYNLCHPGRPGTLQDIVPISAITSERPFHGVFYTGDEVNPTPIPSIFVSYASTPASYFSSTPSTAVGADDNGIGHLVLNLTSATSGNNVTIVTYLSSYSTGLSAVLGNGNLYGIEPMIISSSATFTVSANISATTSTTTITASTKIIAGRPALQSDAVGAGTPQELSYPTSALNTPLVFSVNPHTYTNVFSELLIRPLYQSQRTLSKTTTIQFNADQTDLEIKLTWIGGGNRFAMDWTMFSNLYNYFNNPPNAANGEYIQWAPKDLSNHVYNVLLVNLECGGSNLIQLNNLAKTLDGFVTETVTLTMRIVSTVE